MGCSGHAEPGLLLGSTLSPCCARDTSPVLGTPCPSWRCPTAGGGFVPTVPCGVSMRAAGVAALVLNAGLHGAGEEKKCGEERKGDRRGQDRTGQDHGLKNIWEGAGRTARPQHPEVSRNWGRGRAGTNPTGQGGGGGGYGMELVAMGWSGSGVSWAGGSHLLQPLSTCQELLEPGLGNLARPCPGPGRQPPACPSGNWSGNARARLIFCLEQ